MAANVPRCAHRLRPPQNPKEGCEELLGNW